MPRRPKHSYDMPIVPPPKKKKRPKAAELVANIARGEARRQLLMRPRTERMWTLPAIAGALYIRESAALRLLQRHGLNPAQRDGDRLAWSASVIEPFLQERGWRFSGRPTGRPTGSTEEQAS